MKVGLDYFSHWWWRIQLVVLCTAGTTRDLIRLEETSLLCLSHSSFCSVPGNTSRSRWLEMTLRTVWNNIQCKMTLLMMCTWGQRALLNWPQVCVSGQLWTKAAGIDSSGDRKCLDGWFDGPGVNPLWNNLSWKLWAKSWDIDIYIYLCRYRQYS